MRLGGELSRKNAENSCFSSNLVTIPASRNPSSSTELFSKRNDYEYKEVSDFLIKQCIVSSVAWENNTRLLYAQIMQGNVNLRFQASSVCLSLRDLHSQYKSVGTETFFRCSFLVVRFVLACIFFQILFCSFL